MEDSTLHICYPGLLEDGAHPVDTVVLHGRGSWKDHLPLTLWKPLYVNLGLPGDQGL